MRHTLEFFLLFFKYSKTTSTRTPERSEHKKKKDLRNSEVFVWSGYQDSNLGPPAPKAGALTGLRYIPYFSQLRCKDSTLF